MKRKRDEKRKRHHQQTPKKSNYWLTVILAAFIPTCILTGTVYRIPARFVVPPVIILMWIVASLFVWQRANARAYGDEWWQDHR